MHFVNKNTGKLININPKFAGVCAELLRHPGYRLANDADFKESDHPRDKSGKFTSGGGSSSGATEKALSKYTSGGGNEKDGKKLLSELVETTSGSNLESALVYNNFATEKTAGKLAQELTGKAEPKASVGRLSKRTHEQGQHLKGKLLQTDINRLQPGQRQEFVDLYEKAAAVKDTFDSKNEAIAKEVGGKAAIVPLKGSTRAVDKIIGDYDGDPSQIKDLLRTTIEIKDLSEVDNVLAKLGESYSIEEKGFRNLLKEGTDSLGGSGYRDMKMNVKIDGVYAEIQVNFPQMLEAKEKMHGHYEQISEILRSASKTKGIMSKEDNDKIASLNQEMKDVYDAAWESIIASKAS